METMASVEAVSMIPEVADTAKGYTESRGNFQGFLYTELYDFPF